MNLFEREDISREIPPPSALIDIPLEKRGMASKRNRVAKQTMQTPLKIADLLSIIPANWVDKAI